MSITWHGPYRDDPSSVDGYDPQGRVAVQVVRYSTGWHAYLRLDPVEDRVHDTMEAAMAAAVAAWELAPEPPSRPGRDRRLVANVEGEVPPHPGVLRRPPE